ncbi:YheC/YheD family endospore coat-associated protein [Paenibacillus xylaniclasticus]|uniref:YheC/YheD family endospore coat-associated protein n=1 Tax=Paenibacillus xylaniclasticus TaxID=588083 RepID=UPI000FD752AF|nr:MULTISPECIES: YheC/YheD family protein [Paenibacillus]GFN30884.1 endospore coat-associated protein YheD [Paenibacillus curdlanolyticus]
MPKSKVAVQTVSSGLLPDDAITLGESYLKQWKIPLGQPIMLKLGSYRQPVKVISIARYGGMRISQSLARRVGLGSSATLRLHYSEKTSTLSLGPIIGVMISRDYPKIPDRPFGPITLFCKELVDGCAEQGAHVFFFTPNGIPDDSDSVEGWVYHNAWKKMTLPIPDIVNNRITSRKLESKPRIQQFLKEVKQQHSAQVFNEKFLDKHEVFDALKRDPALTKYLPESHLLRSFTMLKAMCAKYDNVFLKPIRGSLGKGIIKITRLENDSFLAMFTTSAGSRKQHYASLLKLFSAISGKMRTVRYQVQQGLTLIDISKRPVDFRALVQKNAAGKWTVTSIVARTAGGTHFVSNLARGGTLSTVREAIGRSNLITGRQEAPSRLQKAALEIAEGVDKHIPSHFGELGIDLAIDTSGRVWLLEVNSKPSKSDNTPLTEQKIRPSVLRMIQYSRYLSGF